MLTLIVFMSVLSAPGEQVITTIEDSTISARVNTLYLLNEHLNPLNITVKTQNGNVMLTGSVNDEVQKELAEDLALGVSGVGFVDNRLVVINTVIGEKERRTWKQRVSDRALSASVKTRLLMNGEFKGLKTGISAINGVVTLYGVVPTEEHVQSMLQVASETKGVVDVVNNLTVRRKDDSYDAVRGVGRAISDEWVESRVETAVILNRHLSIRELNVEVDDGICILTGTVNSEGKKELAGQIADSIAGVSEVRNNIIVRPGDEVELLSPSEQPDLSRPADAAPATGLEGSEPREGGFLIGSEPEVEEAVLAAP